MSEDRYGNFRTNYRRREVAAISSRVVPRDAKKLLVNDFVTKPQRKRSVHKQSPSSPTLQPREVVTKPLDKSPLYAEPKQQQGKFKKSWKLIFTPKYMLPAMAVSLFLIGLGVSLQGFYNNHQAAKAQDKNNSAVEGATTSDDSEKPDETEPDPKTYGSYQVAPDLPRYVRINKIGLNSRVQRVGVKANGELKSPNNIYNVGWYENSAKPGDDGGATLLDAHVHGPTKPGAFYKLKNVTDGDIIEVERGDGQKINYKVVSKESVPTGQVDMAKTLVSADTSKAGLNLITCDGDYNSSSGDYENRLVVYAVRI